MFLSPYQTTACSATAGLPSMQDALKRALVHDDLPVAATLKGHQVAGVFMVPPYVKDIKPFALPLPFQMPSGSQGVAIDVRGFTKQLGEKQLKVIAGGEYEGAVLRAALTRAWLDGGVEDMRRWNDISARVFIRLISEALVRRLGLSPLDQQGIVVATGLLYYSNFHDFSKGPMDREDFERIGMAVARATRLSPQTVVNMLDADTPQVTNLDGYCDALRHIVKNPRLEKVDPGFIVALTGGLWFGGQARLVLAVALEYPPVWLALMYQALTDRSMHNSGLAKMAETENRGNAGAQFIRDVGSYLELTSNE